MSSASPEYLSFACPQCQKRLKAPPGMAGKKINCPKCAASIRVPGQTPVENNEDDWLSLESPKKPAGVNSSQTKQPTSGNPIKPSPSGSLDDEFQLEPIESPSTPKNSPSIPATPNKARSVFDDDLPDLVPLDEQPTNPEPTRAKSKSSDKPRSASLPNTFPDIALPEIALPDLPLEPLEPLSPVAKPKTPAGASNKPKKPSSPMLVGSLEELSLDSTALPPDFGTTPSQDFSFPCKVCGTLLYASQARVGDQIRCPDCYSEFSIPSPPAKKKKQPEIKLEEGPGVTFAPIDAQSARTQDGDKAKSDELLNRAAEDLEKDREELDDINATFDSKRWISLIFGYFQDPMVIVATVSLGLLMAAWCFAMSAAGSMLGLEETAGLIARIVIFIVFSVPLLGAICMCGLSILTMGANRSPRVTEWPFSRFGEAIGECFMVLGALIAASIPGGMIGALTNVLGAHPLLTLGFTMVSIWAFTPLILLCMIDNGSMFEPYSKDVIASIKTFSDAWGAMYMQTGLAMFFMWGLAAIANFQDPFGDAVFGMFFPCLCFFVFNQFGVLAGRISGATSLGFEGDFSDD